MRRRARLLRLSPLCSMCELNGIVSLAKEVDHIIPLHIGGPDVDSNTQNLCIACHKIKTGQDGSSRFKRKGADSLGIKEMLRPLSLKPSRVPLTIVCGPAAGGKSTYVHKHKSPQDLVIDMDVIRAELGIGANEWNAKTLYSSLKRRNEILNSLASSSTGHAWFIVSAASSEERDWWFNALQPSRMVIVLASKDTCLSRIRATRSGDRAFRSVKAAIKWWHQFDNNSLHEIVESDG